MSKVTSKFSGSASGSPLVIPPGSLAAATIDRMSTVEGLLKAQVQDVVWVCNAVNHGDLSQKITVPVQGVVMVQLNDFINTMVYLGTICEMLRALMRLRLTNSDNSPRKSLVSVRKSKWKGTSYFCYIYNHF
jgi:osomolarity two-component system sensor histidine kinase NIK1